MDSDYIILEGKDYDKLIEEGMKQLEVKKEKLHIEVLEKYIFVILQTET